MEDVKNGKSAPGKMAPQIDPDRAPLRADELREDISAKDRSQDEAREPTAPSEIDVERGDSDEPGAGPDELVPLQQTPPD